MYDYLFQMPDLALFALLSVISIVASLGAIYLVKVFIPLPIRYKDDTVIGNTASLISVIYGVLAGLSALYLINNNSYTADAVQREANAVADIYRDSKWLQPAPRDVIQNQIKLYLQRIIQVEWPVMEHGNKVDNNQGNLLIDNITNELIHYNGKSGSEELLLHDMLDEVRTLYDARQQRIHMSESELSPELWIVILLGSILTLCINYLFGMNFYLHIVTVSAAALMTSSMIFLLITLDRPFQGEFIIEPTAFQSILDYIDTSHPKTAQVKLTAPKMHVHKESFSTPTFI